MKRIWAPWRLQYILGEHVDAKPAKTGGRRKTSCVFCGAQKGRMGVQNLVLMRGQFSYVVMNKFPYTNGHLMVIPNRHTRDFTALTQAEHAEMGHFMGQSMSVLNALFKPDGFNVGMNLGQAAGAGIREHLHYHIVPRWNGDHNFMPVMSDVRVMLETLKKTYQRLAPSFKEWA